MKAHLVRWDRKYADRGLVVIDITDGEHATLEAVKTDVEKTGRAYPTLWDEGSKNTETYGAVAPPAGYLVGTDGKVVWEGVPLKRVKRIEGLIQRELGKVKD